MSPEIKSANEAVLPFNQAASSWYVQSDAITASAMKDPKFQRSKRKQKPQLHHPERCGGSGDEESSDLARHEACSPRDKWEWISRQIQRPAEKTWLGQWTAQSQRGWRESQRKAKVGGEARGERECWAHATLPRRLATPPVSGLAIGPTRAEPHP